MTTSAATATALARPRSLPVVACVLATITGAIAAATSPLLVVIGVAFVAAALLILYRPELGASVTIAAPIVIPSDVIAAHGVRAFGGGITLTDALLALTVAGWAIGALVTGRAVRLPRPAVSIAVAVFLVVVIANAFALRSPGVALTVALTDLRPLLALALVFVLVDRLRPQQLRRWAFGFVVLSVVPSLITMARYLAGQGSVAAYSGGAIRVFGTFFYPVIALVWACCLLQTESGHRARLVLWAAAILAASAVFFTFQRTAWLALLAGVAAVLAFATPRQRRRVALGSIVAMVAMLLLVSVVNASSAHRVSSPLAAGINRLDSVLNNDDVSRRHREAEFSYVISRIERHPVLGTGLGTSVTFYSPMYSSTTNRMGGYYTNTYIHNSYLFLLLKVGLVGTLPFLAVIGSTLARAARSARDVDPLTRTIALGTVASLVMLLLLAASGPHLTTPEAVPFLAALIAAIEVLPRTARWRVGAAR